MDENTKKDKTKLSSTYKSIFDDGREIENIVVSAALRMGKEACLRWDPYEDKRILDGIRHARFAEAKMIADTEIEFSPYIESPKSHAQKAYLGDLRREIVGYISDCVLGFPQAYTCFSKEDGTSHVITFDDLSTSITVPEEEYMGYADKFDPISGDSAGSIAFLRWKMHQKGLFAKAFVRQDKHLLADSWIIRAASEAEIDHEDKDIYVPDVFAAIVENDDAGWSGNMTSEEIEQLIYKILDV